MRNAARTSGAEEIMPPGHDMESRGTLESSTSTRADGQGEPRAGGADGPIENGATQFQAGRVIGVSVAHLVNDIYTSFTAPLLPAFIAKLALSKTEAGILAFLQSSPSLLQPFIGHLADRADLRYLVIFAPAVTGTMMSLLGLAPRYALLALFLMVAGLSSASLHAVAPAMAGRLSGRSLGRGMGLWSGGGILGFAVGPFIVVSAVNLLSLEGTPWLMIGGWIGSAILYLRLRSAPVPEATNAGAGSLRQGLRSLRPVMVPVVGITVSRALLTAAILIFLPTFLTEQGMSLWFAGVSLSVVHGAGLVGGVLGGWMSDWLGRRAVVFVSMASTSLFMFLFLIGSGWVQAAALLALGVAGPAAQVVLMAVVQESSPDNRALANGVYLSLAFLTEAGAAVVVGALGDLFGLRLAFSVSAVCLLLGLPLVYLLPGRAAARS